MDDVREILSLQDGSEQVDDDADGLKKAGRRKGWAKPKEFTPKRPEGMHRELYSLLCADGGKRFDELAPLYPIDSGGGYQKKLKLGAKKVRQWKWTPFKNPARKDDAVFHHWKRVTDEPKDYPFAKFNKEPSVVQYSEEEYATHLDSDGWTRGESDHLLDLCRRFNLRFTVIHDRWDSLAYGTKTIEDLKERYYSIANVINKLRAEPGSEPKPYNFDADHERRRKDQLRKLWVRTPEQVEEEEFLRAEIKKIEARKRERDKKTQDLQKLITAADAGSLADAGLAAPGTPGAGTGPLAKKNTNESRRAAIMSAKKKTGKAIATLRGRDSLIASGASDVFQGIKWPDFKTAGAFVRSQKMKLPGSVGQKKMKALEQILQKLNVDMVQIPTEEIVTSFNELRSDIVLLYELKSMLAACDMEIQSTAHQYEAATGKKLEIPAALLAESSSLLQSFETGGPGRTASTSAASGSLAASLTVNDLDLPSRKRKAALEQSNILKKLKSKML
ncbi:unnamed protein product [Orchesella dallaii]|uniref:DNA methyltransferase 1-associated protein 1 n=1 Tax=Orchesella dallaii TaxID=48710 RepID=A0ABP1QUB4_9HEXA